MFSNIFGGKDKKQPVPPPAQPQQQQQLIKRKATNEMSKHFLF